MNNTIGFPPADALLVQLTGVDYNKLARQFVMFIVTVAAVVVATTVWFYNRARQWYHNGGKEQVLDVINRVALFINNRTGLVDKISHAVVKFYNRVELIYHGLTDLSEGKLAVWH